MDMEKKDQLSPEMMIGLPKGKLGKYLMAPPMDENHLAEQAGWAADLSQLNFKKAHEKQDE